MRAVTPSPSSSSASKDGTLDSTDPRIFGPPLWTFLHIMAHNYPTGEDLTDRYKSRCRRFILSVSYVLPCAHCGKHFRSYLRSHKEDFHLAFDSRKNMIKFLVDAHNAVRKHTRPNEPKFQVAEAKALYARMRPARPLADVWTS